MQRQNKYHRLSKLVIGSLLLTWAVCNARVSTASVYLDGSATSCSNGSATYSPATRSCGSGNDKVYLDLGNFNSNIVAGTTNYMRAGNYYRTASGGVDGALNIDNTKSGTATSPTIVKAYTGEERQVVIATAADKFQYNPNPGDISGANSVNYYPCPAIHIGGNYITVDGVKTYGMTVFQWYNGSDIHDSAIQNSDLGGGGGNKTNGQGQVVAIYSAYSILVKNNSIHNSCWGESVANGSALMGYNFAATIEYNSFYSNIGNDFRMKDTTTRGSNSTFVRYNFFNGGGVAGIGQDPDSRTGSNALAEWRVYNNVFLNCGFNSDVTITGKTYVYNNTIINGMLWHNSHGVVGTVYGPDYYYNNILYSNISGTVFVDGYQAINGMDYNVYYGTGTVYWNDHEGHKATDISGWKTYSGVDTLSLQASPGFVNSTGTTAADFKRTSYTENFTGSSYSTKAGAYVTGNETIGFTPGSSSSTVSAPTVIIKSFSP